MTKPLNRRQNAKAATRQKVVDGATELWSEPGSYKEKGGNGIREIATHIGMSTGAVFANFDCKDDLWRAAFGCEPPIDSVLTRSAPDLFRALQALVEIRPDLKLQPDDTYSHRVLDDAEALIERIKDLQLDEQAKRGSQPTTSQHHAIGELAA